MPTSTTTGHRLPRGLSERGQEFWTEFTSGRKNLEPAQLELLAEACRTVDVIDELEETIRRDGMMIAGSKEQMVLHPAIGEVRQQRGTLHRLLSALTAGEGVKSPRAAAGAENVAERWDSQDTEVKRRLRLVENNAA